MADKKTTRSDRMYNNSPRLERDGEGKMGITKAEKKSSETNAGTEGIPEHDKAAMEMTQKHETERLDLHHKHEKEHHALSSKHMKEGSPAEEKTESKAEEKAETKAEKSKGAK